MLLTLTVGCATALRPRPITWKILGVRQADSPAPQVERNELILDGRAVRSTRTFGVPLMVALEVVPDAGATNAAFYLQFDPVDAVQRNLPGDFLAVKVAQVGAEKALVLFWVARGSQPKHLLPLNTIVPRGESPAYRLTLESKADALILRINERTFKIEAAFPYEQFYIQLRAFPPAGRWRVRNFVVQ